MPIRLPYVNRNPGAVPVTVVTKATFDLLKRDLSKAAARWVAHLGFVGAPNSLALLPDSDGRLASVMVGLDENDILSSFAFLQQSLPAGTYALQNIDPRFEEIATIGFGLGTYVFDRYRDQKRSEAKLVYPEHVDRTKVDALVGGVALVRDLINTPAEDMGPEELEATATGLARRFGAKIQVVKGAALLKAGYRLIHAVGRAAAQAPRLIDFSVGTRGPEVVVVGKGVCFDSGGLDIKSAANMKLMKKDMGGAAHALGLAQIVAERDLPIRLRVLIPAVENAIGPGAFRPLDVIESRAGLTVEIGNTDAEGRLVMADAMHEAGAPDLLIDFSTLTGAARVALGTGVPALFSNRDEVAQAVVEAAAAVQDPVWRLPLHQPYRKALESTVADLNNGPDTPYGGAILAALFLESFVPKAVPWVHLDLMGWNVASSPGRPMGGEAMGLRAIVNYLERFATETVASSSVGPKKAARRPKKPKEAS